MHELSACEFEMAIENLKRDKSPVFFIKSQQNWSNQGVEQFFEIYKLINTISNKKELPG